jgi:hypothetical protein
MDVMGVADWQGKDRMDGRIDGWWRRKVWDNENKEENS